jgi:(p)ppGpp synthase/HD superfamily hydrolase
MIARKDMSQEELIELAEQIATEAHAGQFRRGGIIPYIEHPRTVAGRVGGDPEAQIVAWLHDVLEDSEHTAESLQAAGIPSHLVAAVVLLTKTPETVYDDYLGRVAASPIAAKVKIADMLSNLADDPTPKQIRKYAKGLLRLVHHE